ncbi:MAG: hypothetical protein ACHQHN_10315 [Sphingobacteriales bacterium]
MRPVFFLILLLISIRASSQSTDDLKQYPVKKGVANAALTKEFSRIIKSYSNNFAVLKSEDKTVSIVDTVYRLKLNFKEKNDATLTFEKSDINLSISFYLDAAGVKAIFNEISSALPADFVYTREYDAEAKQTNYIFFSKNGPINNYPEKIYLITDANNTAVLTILKYR